MRNNNVKGNVNSSAFTPYAKYVERMQKADPKTAMQMQEAMDKVHDMAFANVIDLAMNDNTLLGLAADAEMCLREALNIC